MSQDASNREAEENLLNNSEGVRDVSNDTEMEEIGASSDITTKDTIVVVEQDKVATSADKVPAAADKKPSKKQINRFYHAYNSANEGAFFEFRKLLRKTNPSDVFSSAEESKMLQLNIKGSASSKDLFEKPLDDEKNESLFELILKSNGDARYISLIWEEYQLWKQNSVLTYCREGTNTLPIQHVVESGVITNLFSFLVFDWHNPDKHMANKDKKYFLEQKNQQMIELYDKSLFQKLYKIIDENEVYHDVCLRIIYEYLAEMNKRVQKERKANRRCQNDDELAKLVSLDDLLLMTNKEYRSKICEILITYWDILGDLKSFKNRILEVLQPSRVKYFFTFLYDTVEVEEVTFFDLAFKLIERKHNEFERDFEKYIESMKRNSGNYYETNVKPCGRLLLKIARTQRMSQVQTFIFHKCSYVEINSTPLTNFQEFYKFNNKNIYPLNKKESEILRKMKEAFNKLKEIVSNLDGEKKENYKKNHKDNEDDILQDFRDSYKLTAHKNSNDGNGVFGICAINITTRNLLFEYIKGEKSLFERILETPGMSSLIHVIWDEFELWRKERVLKMVSPHGKLLIEFAIDSKDDRNLIAFLMPKSDSESMAYKKYFLKMQSQQYYEVTKKTLFEHYLAIKDDCTRDNFFEVCFYLLEEIDFIHDIEKEACVDFALSKANNYKLVASVDETDASIGNVEESEEQKKARETYERKYDCDKLLKYFAAYWTKNDANYEKYKAMLIWHSPFFEMIFYILEGDEDKFIAGFHDSVGKLVNSYDQDYCKRSSNENMMQEDLFILFRTAMKNNQKLIMTHILNFESFESLAFNFPRYKKANENNHFAAQKLLENGYDLYKDQIPNDWVSEQVLTEYLDSLVTVLDQDVVQMNSNFLLCSYDRRYKIKSKEDVDAKMLFDEPYKTLDFIVKNETLKDMILHPVISTYINLKSFKYQWIYYLNFFLFFFLYMLPFGLLITYHSFEDLNQTFLAYYLIVLEVICVSSTTLLTIREFVQMMWVSKTWIAYFGRRSNQLEIMMITLSWVLLFGIFHLNIDEHFISFSFISTLYIITSTVVLLTMLPFKSMPIYMMMLKKVSTTFIRFFGFFVFILFSFSISFCVIFRPKNVKSISESLEVLDDNATTTSLPPETMENDEEDGFEFKNFDTIIRSFFKTVLMLSGEYTIEPFTLTPPRMIIFFIFVLTSFVLHNLILGLALDDVQGIRREAEILNLRYEAKKFIESARKWKETYDMFCNDIMKTTDSKNDDDTELDLNIEEAKLVWWKRYAIKIMRALVINHCFIHKIGKIYVNMKTKEVSFEINRKQEAALTQFSGGVQKYFMEQEVFGRLNDILKERNEKEFAAFKKEMEDKAELEKQQKGF